MLCTRVFSPVFAIGAPLDLIVLPTPPPHVKQSPADNSYGGLLPNVRVPHIGRPFGRPTICWLFFLTRAYNTSQSESRLLRVVGLTEGRKPPFLEI